MAGTSIAVPSGSYNLGDFLQTPYGLKGEALPENALELQNLNRKRQMANLLLQRAMSPRQGGMAGRFYVGPGWGQGAEQIGQALAGLYMNKQFDEQQRGVMDRDAETRAKAVQDFMAQMGPQTVQEPAQGPGAPQPNPALNPATDPQTGQPVVPGSEQNFTAAMQGQIPAYVEGPQPTIQKQVPASREQIAQAMMQGRMSRIPEVQQAAMWQQQQMAAQDEKDLQRSFLHAEKEADRQTRELGIKENAAMRAAQIEGNILTTSMLINEREARGQDTNDLKKMLADQRDELERWKTKTETESRERIAAMKTEGPEQKKALEKAEGQKMVNSLIATIRDSYNQLREGGGIVDTEGNTLSNIGAGIASSGAGQTAGGVLGTKNQSLRNTIAQQRPLLMQAIMKATGMTAKQMDSNVELKLWLSTATDPKLDFQTNMKALDQLEKLFGGAGEEPPSAPAPSGLTPGTVQEGYRFKGGDPAKQESWEKVQ